MPGLPPGLPAHSRSRIAPDPTAAEIGTEAATRATDATGLGSAGIATGAELATAALGTAGSATATATGAASAAGGSRCR